MDSRLDLGIGAEQAWSSTGTRTGTTGTGTGAEPGTGTSTSTGAEPRPGLDGEGAAARTGDVEAAPGELAPREATPSRSHSVVQLLVEQAEVADVLLLNKRDQVDTGDPDH